MTRLTLLLLLLLSVTLTACERALGSAASATPAPTPTAVAQAPGTPLPTTLPATPTVATATPTAAATPTVSVAEATVVVGGATAVAELLNESVVVERLELAVMESMPVQVQAKLSGHFSLSCTVLEGVTIQRAGNTFTVQFQATKDIETPCVEAKVPFGETIILDVAGLPAGDYTVIAGDQNQSFTLDVDNLAPTPPPSPSLTPEPPAATPTPVPATATTVPGDAGANVPVNGLFTRTYIHLIAIEDAGASGPAIGCGDSVIPVVVDIEPTAGVMTAAFNRLLSIKDQFYGESGLYNALSQSSLTLSGINIVNGVATVSLNGQLMLNGTCDAPRVQAQLEQTALQYSTVSGVNILVNGIPLAEVLSQQ